jgi:hypothetical protein
MSGILAPAGDTVQESPKMGSLGRRPNGRKHRGHLILCNSHEGPHNCRVELCATCCFETPDGLLERQPCTIRTRRNHGIESIDDRHDAGANWDFGALEARRIASAVEVFVVMQDVQTGTLQPGYIADYRPAKLRVT